MEEKYELFNDLKRSNIMQDILYYRKGRIGFNEILVKIPDDLFDAIHGDVWKQFEWGLKYVYPLIESGKLKARILRHKDGSIFPGLVPDSYDVVCMEYGKGQGKKFVQDAEKYYKKCENEKIRMNFCEWSILFTLPENEWPY